MSIIQSIRDKAAWIIIAAIALALIAFIVQEAFPGGGGRGLFGGDQTTVGKINGNEIDYRDFETRSKKAEDNYKAQNYPVDARLSQQIRESIWNEYVEDIVLGEEFQKLGFTAISKDERGDILYGATPPQQLAQQFRNAQGGYDATAAHAAIAGLKKNSPEFNSFWGEFVPALEKNRMKEKFMYLISNSAYTPKWLVEKANTENSQISSISYVNIPYATISDSTIKVSDDEVRQYVEKHKEAYQQEESRGIEYVMFDAAPTKEDSAKLFNEIASKKEEFAAVSGDDAENFIVRNNTETPFYNGYILGSQMQVTNADTIKRLADGAVYGPYLDGGNYTLAKMIGRRSIPDSVKSRHILIKINPDPQQGVVRTDSAAKQLIDSIVTAIRGGANFDSMVVKFSDDAGSKEKGGVYEFSSVQFGSLSKEFAETIFYGNTGDKKTVKVENQSYAGYHYIEVLNQKSIGTAYKIAYLSRGINASPETITDASNKAGQFAANSRNKKQFDENAQKQNLNKFPAMDLKPQDAGIPGLGDNRDMVQWAYNKAKVGDVAENAYQVGDKYVVPVLLAIYEKGNMSVQRARPMVEYKIRNKKKAEQIIQKVGSANTLDAIGKATNQPVLRADSISYASPFVPNVGNELKLIGAAFNPDNKAKVSTPIEGEIGVFYLKVENISATANPNFDVKAVQKQMTQSLKMSGVRILDALRKTADVKDNRVRFF